MTVTSLRHWTLDNGVYISPRFQDVASYNRAKRFLIRAQIVIDCDDRNRLIKIPIAGKLHENNLDKLKKLHLIT